MATKPPFTYEIQYSEIDPSEDLDSRGRKVTTIICRGSLVAETRDQIDQIFKETAFHGRVIFNLAGLDYLDSSGIGALIRLKLHAVKEGGVSVKFDHMTPKVMQLLKLADLADWFSS